MKDTNSAMRALMRWTHLLTALPLVALACAPARESEAFALFVQVGLIPALVLSGGMMWRRAHPGRPISATRRWRRKITANDPG